MPVSKATFPLGAIPRLWIVVFVVFLALFGSWASYYTTNFRVNANPTSQPDLAAAREKAQSLIGALEKYHAENSLYPTTLNLLVPRYVAAIPEVSGFRYSARQSDFVIKSDACAAQDKALHGWIMKEAKDYQKEVRDFEQECVIGFRSYQLQSQNFPPDPQNAYVKRWAYYDSSKGQWSVGWCAYSQRRGPQIGMNGVCPSVRRDLNDPW